MSYKETTNKKYKFTDFNKVDSNLLKKLLSEHTFSISLNANDTFGYACAESVNIDVHDLWKLLDVYELFGDDGVTAFMAHYENSDVLKERKGDKYKEATEYLKDFVKLEEQ